MASRQANAHIEAQARLRRLVTRAVEQRWDALGTYDRDDIPRWLAAVLPIVSVGQQQSVNLTNAFIASVLERQPVGIDPGAVVRQIRGDTTPAEVYERPFVRVWHSLSEGVALAAAFSAGRAYASSAAAMDVQMAMRGASQAVQDASEDIYGFARVADGGACAFCLEVDGAYVKSADAAALHNFCGCGLEPLTGPSPLAARLPDGTPVRDLKLQQFAENTAIHTHGELGPVLGDAAHDFTSEAAIN